jgi:hypothetical protein
MKKILITAVSIAGLLITGCASQRESTIEPFMAIDLNPLLASGQYQQKADNFFVINDSSDSMSEEYLGPGFAAGHAPAKLSVEKEILARMNKTIPDLKFTTSIRSFGTGPCTSWHQTLLHLAPTSYSKAAFLNLFQRRFSDGQRGQRQRGRLVGYNRQNRRADFERRSRTVVEPHAGRASHETAIWRQTLRLFDLGRQ